MLKIFVLVNLAKDLGLIYIITADLRNVIGQ